MPLTLRRTGLGSGVDRPAYMVCCGGWEVGRLYQMRGGPDCLRWFWSLTVSGPMTRSDKVATLDEAKALEGVGKAGRACPTSSTSCAERCLIGVGRGTDPSPSGGAQGILLGSISASISVRGGRDRPAGHSDANYTEIYALYRNRS